MKTAILVALILAAGVATKAEAQLSIGPSVPDLSGYLTSAQADARYKPTDGMPPASTAQLAAAITGLEPKASLAADVPPLVPSNYVSGFSPAAPGLTANLLANAPCIAGRLGSYAVVSDLWSGGVATNEVLRCGSSGAAYYWRPQRTDYAANVSVSGGSITASCLVTPPIMFVAGTLVSNATITLSASNCWPGAQFQIANNATVGLFGVTVGGLIGGTTKALGASARVTAVFDGTSWNVF